MAAHRNAPQPDPACLYGLIGDVARAGSDGTETNAYAIAANFMVYLSSVPTFFRGERAVEARNSDLNLLRTA